jgi:glucose repression regulatory protein TUP1
MNILQQTLIDLERTQQMLKKQLRIQDRHVQIPFANSRYRYEEEISRLRQQLDHGGSSVYHHPTPIDNKPPQPKLSSPATSSHNSPHFKSTNTKVPPLPPPSSQNTIPLSELDPESVPANMKIEGSDWFAL